MLRVWHAAVLPAGVRVLRARPAAPASEGARLTGAPTRQGASNVRCALVRVPNVVAACSVAA